MAYFGLAKLEAVNLILETNQIKRVSALDSAGSWPSKTYGASDAGHAEFTLDMISRRVQARGLGCNTVRSKKFTLGGSGPITLGANTLAIVPAGPTQFKNHGIRNDAVYDLEGDTATLAAGDYFYDVITALDFESLDPLSKEMIVDETKLYYQRRTRGDQLQDQFNENDRQKTELFAVRPKPSQNSRNINQIPVIPAGPQQQQGQ